MDFPGDDTSITGKFLSDRKFLSDCFFADQSASKSFREKSQVVLWYFSTARTSLRSGAKAPASLASFSRIVLSFRGPGPLTNRSEKILGGIVAVQHCPNIEEFNGSVTGITGKFLSDRSFRGPVRSQIVPRKFFR